MEPVSSADECGRNPYRARPRLTPGARCSRADLLFFAAQTGAPALHVQNADDECGDDETDCGGVHGFLSSPGV